MISFLNFIISKLKKTDYKLDNSIRLQNILGIIYFRILAIWRGAYKRIGLKSVERFLLERRLKLGIKIELKLVMELL